MNTFVLLLRGINVGGKNKVPMQNLKACLESLGYHNVRTYIASGNVLLSSRKTPKTIQAEVEKALPEHFKLDSDLLKTLVLTREQLSTIVHHKPKGFGEEPDRYHCDAVFLIDIDIDTALSVFAPREGVDKVWPGTGVIYSQRLSTELTKSRLSKIIGTPAYKSMTIRSWNTTTKLLELLTAAA